MVNAEEYLEHFAYRILQDALNEATASYWERRAETFEWVKPAIGEFHGRNGRDQLSEQWRRADRTAQMCRHRASLAREQDEHPDEVWAALHEGGEPWQDATTRLAS